jgi:cell division protein FtsW (lipid II flippase)
VITLILVAVGLLMMLSVSLAMALDNPKFAKFSLLKQQGVAVVIGFGLMLLLTRLDYHKWGRVSVLLLGATIALLVAVHLPGLGPLDSSRSL